MQPSTPSAPIPEWDGCNLDAVMKRLKSISKEELDSVGRREFYKSYTSWEKMTVDQRNKTVSYFQSLPEELQGLCLFLFILLLYLLFTIYYLLKFHYHFIVTEMAVLEAIQ
jgi:hypothetical protein